MSSRRLGLVAPLLAVFLAGGACGTLQEAPSAATEAPPVDAVVAISIDGLNPAAIRWLGEAGTPTLHRLMEDGASTLNARTEFEQTETLPNHTGMVTGRRIDRSTGGHGVTWNDDRRRPRTVQAAAGHTVESVFTQVHGAGELTGLFASKTKFSLFDRSWPAAVDVSTIIEDDRRLARAVRRDLASTDRAFRFVHFALPDRTGHDKGFMSAAYLDAVRGVDRLVGTLLDAIESDPDLAGRTAVIVTSDHGGKGPSHYQAARLANYRVPFFVLGPDVAAGADLYALNPDYADPGRNRTTYADALQPVRNGAVANLALDLLGLPPVPDSEHAVQQDLDVGALQP
ncbi:hypothetical protein DDE18_19870 [Nocardioides gansuensis]|uniref:Phosphodiesterase n=1 Tax=Nocardioides gansuensis TaxID=2138300 RepID=A0A2T8F5T6_9ACTN|nr:alkaline phosphatase family protein [Nocardioides gansuensis]PVG81074.1 hypothetical protein DDE18_19870 [Nocardioides gansuensis]